MDILKFRKILKRFSTGKANETESALVEAWYRSYAREETPVDNKDVEQLRSSILENIEKSIGRRRKLYTQLSGIAASLILVSTALFFVLKENRGNIEYSVYSTGTKETKEILLADGSSVWLNANTQIKTPKGTKGELRQVSIEQGEVFFKVKKDAAHPFIVHAGSLQVKVLGTSFDIKAYKEFKTVSVSVVTGKVAVIQANKTLSTLTPGQQLLYNLNDHQFQLKEIDSDKIVSWKQGSTYLEQADFDELSVLIKNLYGLNIKAGSEQVKTYRFSLKIIHSLSQQEVLALIEQLHNSEFRKEGNDLILY
ncbi:FecR family protein [Pedobacter nyackensis]|uniref:FecR family protein n=1 Tax=Pedobacter nyackensis TaxID=475255 RepID=UPI002930A1B0|nr:FecR domain-containing protein [Pedobacter nyackensis]